MRRNTILNLRLKKKPFVLISLVKPLKENYNLKTLLRSSVFRPPSLY
jgi:hypothetical protein